MNTSQQDENSTRLQRFTDLRSSNLLADLGLGLSTENIKMLIRLPHAYKTKIKSLQVLAWVVVRSLLQTHNTSTFVEWFLKVADFFLPLLIAQSRSSKLRVGLTVYNLYLCNIPLRA